LKCQSTWKLCPSTRWTTFIKVDFEVLRWNLGNEEKVPDDIRRRQRLRRFWPCLWPRVDYGCVQTWSRVSLGFIGEVFGVMAQVDLGLTGVWLVWPGWSGH
jgi:hypothetical protein